MLNIEDLPTLSKQAQASSISFFKKNKKQLKSMDSAIHSLHNTFSEKYNCLQCANCCQTLGPRITEKDIDKIAKALRCKPSEIMEKYIMKDEDNDFVFKSMPCPFLMPDNYCQIYESRPKACKEYPHTNRKNFYQIYTLSVKNASTCPIVYEILEHIKK